MVNTLNSHVLPRCYVLANAMEVNNLPPSIPGLHEILKHLLLRSLGFEMVSCGSPRSLESSVMVFSWLSPIFWMILLKVKCSFINDNLSGALVCELSMWGDICMLRSCTTTGLDASDLSWHLQTRVLKMRDMQRHICYEWKMDTF